MHGDDDGSDDESGERSARRRAPTPIRGAEEVAASVADVARVVDSMLSVANDVEAPRESDRPVTEILGGVAGLFAAGALAFAYYAVTAGRRAAAAADARDAEAERRRNAEAERDTANATAAASVLELAGAKHDAAAARAELDNVRRERADLYERLAKSGAAGGGDAVDHVLDGLGGVHADGDAHGDGPSSGRGAGGSLPDVAAVATKPTTSPR